MKVKCKDLIEFCNVIVPNCNHTLECTPRGLTLITFSVIFRGKRYSQSLILGEQAEDQKYHKNKALFFTDVARVLIKLARSIPSE
jgi:hypothetical protein